MNMRIAIGGLMILGAGQVVAADWSFDPKVAVLGIYNDNVELTNLSSDEISVTGAELDAQLKMRAVTPRSYFDLTPRLRSTFYPSESEQEAFDQFVPLSVGFNTQRTRTTLKANWSHITMLGNYFPSAVIAPTDELGQPDPGDGVVQVGPKKNWQEQVEITPAVVFELAERHALELRVGYLDTQYDVQVLGDTQDFSTLYGLAGYSLRLSETARLSFRGAYSTYDPTDGVTTSAYGLDAEWSNEISETSEWYARAGVNNAETQTDASGNTSRDTGFGGGAGVRWAFEVSQLFLDLNHGLSPSSAGSYVNRDQLRAEWTRRITPLVNVSLGARWIMESGTGDNNSFDDRSYATGKIGFDWRFARKWSLAGSYTYQWQEYDQWTTNAQSNGFKLGVVWEPHRL